tara:strand:+ start:805 stop:1002 length:198 start_codon:yes stop_codon:yes gene_type:complete
MIFRAEEMTREQLKSELLDSVYDEYEAHVESHDFDDDERALSVCFSQMPASSCIIIVLLSNHQTF